MAEKNRRNLRLSKMLNKPVRPLKYKADHTWVLPEQCIGVEIELENVSHESLERWDDLGTPRWNYHEDPMLRNSGREFTTSDGLFGQDLLEAVNEFFKFADHEEWVISDRTGIHIHLDVSDLELCTTFKTFMCLYLIMEKPLFSFVGDDRRNNIHCLPWFKAQGNLEKLARLFNDEISDATFKQEIHSMEMERYSALNLASLEKYCTVEFRHMKTTLSREKIVSWINLIMAIKSFSKDYTGKPEDLISWAKKNIWTLGTTVFGLEVVGKYWPYSFAKECALGIEVANDVISLYSPKTTEYNGWQDTGLSLKDGLANRFHEKQGSNPKAVKKKGPFDGVIYDDIGSVG